MGQLNLGNGANFVGGSGGILSDSPKGTVLQTVYATTTTELSTSNSSYQTWFGVTWTPQQTNSHKIITVNAIRTSLTGTDFEANFLISDGTNVTDRWRMYNGTDQTMYKAPCMSWYWTQTHTAGASVTFSAQARDGNTNGTVTWGDNGSNSYIVVQEIAQ